MRPSPQGLPSRRTRLMAALSVVVLAASVAIALPTGAVAAGGVAREVFDLTNAERARAGVGQLVSDPALDAAAAEWAQHLANTCTFVHSTAQWRSSRVVYAGWQSTGENIAAGQANAASVMSTWMGSSGHRANILDSRYTGLGVGFATGSCYRTYWVQIFAIGSPIRHLPGGSGDLNRDSAADVLAVTSTGQLLLYPGNGAGGWGAATTVDPSWGSLAFTPLGDFTSDGVADIARVEANGDLTLLAGNGRGGYLAPVRIGTGWNMFASLIGGLDFNGDRLPDVIGRTAGGDLVLYPGNGTGGWLGGGFKIGNGWAMMDFVFHAGDFTGDTRGDIIARQPNGTLWLYPTHGDWTWGTPRQIGWGWHALTSVFSPGDFDGNGTSDVMARAGDGSLILYRGNGRGGWGAVSVVGAGWNMMRQIG